MMALAPSFVGCFGARRAGVPGVGGRGRYRRSVGWVES